MNVYALTATRIGFTGSDRFLIWNIVAATAEAAIAHFRKSHSPNWEIRAINISLKDVEVADATQKASN